ncbi:MAG TPA: hypothetical protein VMS08_03150 [Candidatus Saccharimonadia bacterium]|nr:hypothetical protein [Candidatus Saccharimonadia bacterium]
MSSFNHVAILGRQPGLSLMELESVAGYDNIQPFGDGVALLRESLDVSCLGGTLKIGEILYRGNVTPLDELPAAVDALHMRSSKTPFAISLYGVNASSRDLLAGGLALKKRLRSRGSVRLITPAQGLTVSAAGLRHNKVLETGFELLVIANQQEMIVARTTGVQDVDWYSTRDYGRPARSAKVGMLPPKLAQILVNSTAASVICDPFCGTGVILQEALLLGREAYGSDVADEMVEATISNLGWLDRQGERDLPHWHSQAADARTVTVPPSCAIVTEGYLGPNLMHSPTVQELGNIRESLLPLYRESLQSWASQLVSGDEVSLCAPVWRIQRAWHYLELVDELPRLGYTLKSFAHVPTPLIYAREDQVVGRQLLLLRKT